ncbi:MAG: D-alanyl-D-alanine carboxypeptidase family protein [Gammaproteobacteria bacterium]|nr:D-alanyl-D-alanine carboxypeptidase family protein [Gammaproteobacteria bacterium]
MKRRDFLGLLSATAATAYILAEYGKKDSIPVEPVNRTTPDVGTESENLQLQKVTHFDDDFGDDVILPVEKFDVLISLRDKLNYIQSYVGYANYSVLNFNELMKYARYNGQIGEFNSAQLALIDELFNENAQVYGFYGERINDHIDDRVDRNNMVKVAGTGQFMFKGQPLQTLKNLERDVGRQMILTSGVRSVVKQLLLFTNKAVSVNGNLSRASRSLAPPGHSFHAIGDFDVGMKGLGKRNFTAEFSNTPVYQQIRELDYIKIRYHETNRFGVRYEPWHIKVV